VSGQAFHSMASWDSGFGQHEGPAPSLVRAGSRGQASLMWGKGSKN